jgi:hypothetical protein
MFVDTEFAEVCENNNTTISETEEKRNQTEKFTYVGAAVKLE